MRSLFLHLPNTRVSGFSPHQTVKKRAEHNEWNELLHMSQFSSGMARTIENRNEPSRVQKNAHRKLVGLII